jgi:hypothetical protein
MKVFDIPEDMHTGYDYEPNYYEVAPNGERFLMMRRVRDESTTDPAVTPNLRLVLNWFEEYREKK